MKFTLIENLSVTLTSEPIDVNALLVAAMFGGKAPTDIAFYNQDKVYNKQAKILVTDNNGSMTIYTCKADGTTGPFDITKWTQFNLFAGSGVGGSGSLNDGAVLSRFNSSIIDTVMNI